MKTTREMILEELREMIGKELDVLEFMAMIGRFEGFGNNRPWVITRSEKRHCFYMEVKQCEYSPPLFDTTIFCIDYKIEESKKIVTSVFDFSLKDNYFSKNLLTNALN